MSIKHITGCSCGSCPKPAFVQIHQHTDGSSLDGVAKIDKLVAKAKEYDHKALAITDHGTPAMLFQFYKECKKNDIKPILGLEFYITNDLASRVANKGRELEDRDYHQSVYIKDKEGYQNFNYLTYISFTDGYYYKPRIDFDLLFSRKKGLMTTTSCIASKINNYLTAGMNGEAEKLFKRFRDEFGDDFYGEIQFNELNDRDTYGIDQRSNNSFIIAMCEKYDVPIMIGGDVHYVNKDEAELQDVIINSKRQAKEGVEAFQIHARHLYYHQVDDYYDFNKKFDYNYDTEFLEKCFENSVAFAAKSNFEFETDKFHLPKIKTSGMSSDDYIDKVTWEGLIKNIEKERKYFPGKYTAEEITAIEERTEYELGVIKQMGLTDYLLIVYDIIRHEKANGVFVGPGRGSAAGSIVAWALDITGLNPMNHGLLFERFINPNRKTMADIDWDQDENGRQIVLDYLIDTFGRDHVLNVPTYGTYGAKSALADINRGLRKDDMTTMMLNKKITKLPQMDDTLKPIKDLAGYFVNIRQTSMDQDVIRWIDNNQDTIRLADKMVGQMKSIGTHAGGIVVTPVPFYELIPVMRGAGELLAAFREADGSSKDLSELGILKLDVLGLKTLTVMKECIERIKANGGEDLSERIFHLPLEDDKMIKFFATGNNYGIFQMDRSAMFTSRFKNDGAAVDSFKDIVAINAMNRPGPLEKFLPKYGYWKAIDQGKIKITPEELAKVDKERYPFEFMRKGLGDTHGALLYQEQFMQMICDVTGMSFGDADSFRRAIAWKVDNPKYYTVKGYFDRLEQSMLDKGYTKEDVDSFVKYCRDFMGYSFNKCVSGKTRFLRRNNKKGELTYTVEAMWKTMNVEGWAKRNGMLSAKKRFNREGYGLALSLNQFNKLQINRIKDIRYEGVKTTYRMTLMNGATIDTTDNHKFPTSNGMKELKDIDAEIDKIYICTSPMSAKRIQFDAGLCDIDTIELLGEEDVYDVEMDGPDHTFTTDSGIVTCNSHSVAYSYISWQTLYLKVYYPAYFFAAMLNSEKDSDKIQEIIEDARKNSIEILPMSVVKSEYWCKAETETAIRVGYKLVSGMGEAVEQEIKELELSKCKTIDEVLKKPFKKINKTSLDSMIRLGCFDEFGVDRELINILKSLYREPKIEKWFSRKRGPGEEKHMPEILIENFDKETVMEVVPRIIDKEQPHIELINELMPHLHSSVNVDPKKKAQDLQKATIEAEIELMGFSISIDDVFGEFARAMRSTGITSISEWEEGEASYFKVMKINTLTTKNGKTYWQYVLNDGKKDYKAKVWRENKKITDGSYCIGALEYDDNFGFTLLKCEKVK